MPAALAALALALVGARVGLEIRESRREPERLVAWSSLDEARAAAATSGKPVLVYVSASWCLPCRSLSRDVFERPRPARLVGERYEPAKIELDDDGHARTHAERAFLARHGLDGVPRLVVLRGDDVTASQIGHRTARTTEHFLRTAPTSPRRR